MFFVYECRAEGLTYMSVRLGSLLVDEYISRALPVAILIINNFRHFETKYLYGRVSVITVYSIMYNLLIGKNKQMEHSALFSLSTLPNQLRQMASHPDPRSAGDSSFLKGSFSSPMLIDMFMYCNFIYS